MELFASKLQAPVRGNSLVRQRLTRLFKGPEIRRLITVVAGAGYGKTTLIADALAGSEHPVIWYRLDPGDRDPDVFNAYLTRGMIWAFPVLETDERFRSDLQGLIPGTQLEAAGGKFRSPDRYISRLAAVLSKVAVTPSFLVLDDFHTVADSPDICRALEYLLEVLPKTVGVVLLSRREPPLKLSRLRAGGQLTEINETDLSFTAPEIQTFYTADIPLTDADTGHILDKTGGWPASLVLLKYALKDSRGEAIKRRLSGFSGSQSHIFAYLEENFFDAQPGEVQAFMIKANLLAEIDAHRCDRIFGLKGSRKRLAALVREHLLVFPDRENPDIYHFHHLLRDFLNVKGNTFFSESKIRELHRRI
ncbi:MAG: transcriptional regulator, partial [Desulfobacterales bacterium]|nr:transcriptional regulator [Desulfobacterales bacterium]